MKITSIPQLYRNVNRWRQMLTVLSRYGLADWLSRYELDFLKGLFRDRDGQALAKYTREARIRLALSELGPTFVKLGQILSTRPDLVGYELAEELSRLQSSAPADPADTVRALIERELKRPLGELFSEFVDEPVASASIGQVHRARLHSGEEVAVKVQHAGIEEHLRVDFDILHGLAQLAEGVPEFRYYRPTATVQELQRIVRREADFSREVRNMQRLTSELCNLPWIHIPRIYQRLSTPRVLTMEWLDGQKLSELKTANGCDVDLEDLARRGATLYLEMIFVHGFYHADPHPGNILIERGGGIALLDYGMVGQIDHVLQEDMEELLVALADQDSERLTDVITRAGAVPPELDHAALGLEIADFISHYGGQNLDEFNLSSALREMTEIIRRYHITLPTRIAMLIKVFVMLEGLAKQLNPQFNILEMMLPYQQQMAWRRLSPWRHARKLRRAYGELERLAERLPRRISDILQQVQSGKFDVHLDHRGLEPSVNRMVLGLLASALFLGSTILLREDLPPLLFGKFSVLGIAGCTLSILLGLRLIRAINKSGHLDGK